MSQSAHSSLDRPTPSPFRVEQLRAGDRYELSNGHPIYCAPAGREHADANAIGTTVLNSDPDVEWTGVDAGFTPDPGTLRAPDIAVAPAGDECGWIPGAPPLAVEYASTGQDEPGLRAKIADLLRAGARQVWVVRLTGIRRVEVHRPDAPVRIAGSGEELTAPGILRNPVPVAALFDREAAHAATLRNLLQRRGYRDLDHVLAVGKASGHLTGKAEGLAEGELSMLREALLLILQQRELALTETQRALVQDCADPVRLRAWLARALAAPSAGALLESPTADTLA